MKKISILLFFISLAITAQEGTFEQFTYKVTDSLSQPYVFYTPEKIDKSVKKPLIVYLHGAVSTTGIRKDPVGSSKRSVMAKLAEEKGYYVLFPYGNKEASWFNKNGVTMVLSEIKLVVEKYNIDPEKIFLSGFSDGGSGTFYFAATQSSPFAGYIALNGSVSVAANLGASPVYLENINNKPLYVVNTKSDMLYPEKMMLPTIEKIREYGNSVIYKTPEGNHETSYFPSLKEEVADFIAQNRLKTADKISLEVADDFSPQYAWLRLLTINKNETPKAWHTPYSLKMTNDKASFGLVPDTKYEGDPMRVAGFGKNSIAKEMGVQIGDLVTKMEDTEIKGPMTSFTYLAGKKAGEPTSLTILRDGKEIVLKGNFPPPYDYEVFTKNPVSGKIKAEIKGKTISVETSRVGEFEIDFSQLPFKKGKKINVEINGKTQKVKAQGKQVFKV